jgi:hypothetical protein
MRAVSSQSFPYWTLLDEGFLPPGNSYDIAYVDGIDAG